jgi:hypothetical protein
MWELSYKLSTLSYVLLFVASLCTSSYFLSLHNVHAEQSSNSQASFTITKDFIEINSTTEGTIQTLNIPKASLLFDVIGHTDQNGNLLSISIQRKPELQNLYKDLELTKGSHDAVFVYPSFTQAAYEKGGFYDFYRKNCDSSCLTVPIPTSVNGFQSSSIFGAWTLKLLNYSYVKDEDIDKNPDILKQYKRVIVLHNEYVTKKEFDAITSHPDVVFLYPNALYAEVKANYDSNTITLVHGHDYPDSTVKNGFGWQYDNSKFEYNVDCSNWNFYRSGEYTMLNCYPEFKILHSEQLIRSLQNKDPADLLDDINNWLRYPNDPSAIAELLSDYDISGKHVPHWVSNSGVLVINNEISKTDFAHLLKYLYDKNMLD